MTPTSAYLQAAVGIGIGVGSVAAGYLSGGKIEYGLIPLGAVGMTVFGALLYFRAPAESRELIAESNSPVAFAGKIIRSAAWARLRIFGFCFFGGFFAVPSAR